MSRPSLYIRAAAAVRAPQSPYTTDYSTDNSTDNSTSSGTGSTEGAVCTDTDTAAPADQHLQHLHIDYFNDLLAPFGLKPDEELLRSGSRIHHSDLVDLLLADEALAASIPDLLIVAHALPDVVPFTAVAPYLSRRLGGQPTNFAVGQQGLAAPFTALRIASARAAAGRARQTLLAVLEQTTLPTRFDLVQQTPLVDSAAALVLEAGPDADADASANASASANAIASTDANISANANADARANANVNANANANANTGASAGLRFERATHDVSPSVVVKLCGGLDEGAGDTLLVLGPWFPGDVKLPPGPTTLRVREGTYCTSVWIELAQHWQEWQRSYNTVILCDTDPRYGETHGAVFRS